MNKLFMFMLSAILIVGSVFIGWAQEKEPYKIGVVNNSTGALGIFGIVQNRGVELAAELINKAGGVNGHKVVPIIYDGETKPDVNLRMARKLINQDKVKVLIGPNFMAGIKSIAPVVNEKKIPIINFGATVIDPAKDPYMFSFGSNNTIMAQALVEYYHKKGIKKIAIIAVKSSYGEEFVVAYRDCMRKYPDMSIIGTEWFMYEDTDITPQITKLISANPDVIADIACGTATLLVARSAYGLGYKKLLAGTHCDLSTQFAESITDLPTGFAIIPGRNTWCMLGKAKVQAMPDSPRKAYSLKIMDAWEKKYGDLKDIIYGTIGYEYADVYIQAFKAVGYDSEKVKQWLEHTEVMNSTGIIRMIPTDHLGATPENVAILTTENGRFVPMK